MLQATRADMLGNSHKTAYFFIIIIAILTPTAATGIDDDADQEESCQLQLPTERAIADTVVKPTVFRERREIPPPSSLVKALTLSKSIESSKPRSGATARLIQAMPSLHKACVGRIQPKDEITNTVFSSIADVFRRPCEMADPKGHNCWKAGKATLAFAKQSDLCGDMDEQTFSKAPAALARAFSALRSGASDFDDVQGSPYVAFQWIGLSMQEQTFTSNRKSFYGTHMFMLVHDLLKDAHMICDSWQGTHDCRCVEFPRANASNVNFNPNEHDEAGYGRLSFESWWAMFHAAVTQIVDLHSKQRLQLDDFRLLNALFLTKNERDVFRMSVDVNVDALLWKRFETQHCLEKQSKLVSRIGRLRSNPPSM